jgi:hypothetical protein
MSFYPPVIVAGFRGVIHREASSTSVRADINFMTRPMIKFNSAPGWIGRDTGSRIMPAEQSHSNVVLVRYRISWLI